MTEKRSIFQHLALEFVTVTEVGAIAAARWIGKGDKVAADQAAVDAMRAKFNEIDFKGEIVIGEGAKDESAELYIGEVLGKGSGPALDIAVDPLECTSSVAYGRSNAISVIALGPHGTLYKAADSYMNKIVAGPKAKDVIDLEASPETNIKKVAKALGKDVREITVAVIDRPRHEQLIKDIRAAGARVSLFTDGDVSMAYSTCLRESPIDLLIGVGGSTEIVLSAAAVKCLGGGLFARWQPPDEKHIARLNKAGITDFKQTFTADDFVKSDDVTLTATGILPGPFASGVNFAGDHIHTETIVLTSSPRQTRVIKTKHIV